jgi:hypothetical protein
MYWLQRRRKEAGRSEQVTTPGQNHPHWLEARVEGEVPKSENLVVEMGGGIRMLVGNRTQAALAVEAAIGRDGIPEHLGSDNGHEFIAYCMQDWLKAQAIKTLYIKPGSSGKTGTLKAFTTSCAMNA